MLLLPTPAVGPIGYPASASIAVIALHVGYGIPILLRIRRGRAFAAGEWTLRGHHRWVSPLAVLWVIVVCVLFALLFSPRGIPGTAESSWEYVNYAPVAVLGALALVGGWYAVSARRWCTGPRRDPALDLRTER